MQFQEEFAHIFSWVRLAPDCSLPTHFAHIAEHHMQGTHHAELRSASAWHGQFGTRTF